MDNTYTREALAASNTILIAEIALCPKEFFARIMAVDKQTYAICERCGSAYCSNHINRVNNSYYCKDHS
jgi:RNA polymerase-binding transcription factor DksA